MAAEEIRVSTVGSEAALAGVVISIESTDSSWNVCMALLTETLRAKN
jgi:hypothetical protein